MAGGRYTSEQLNTVLCIIVKLLKSYNVSNWFIAYGTLLGIVRNESCINMDDDIDIILDGKEKDKIHQMIKDNKYTYFSFGKDVMNKRNFIKIQIHKDLPSVDFYLADVDISGNFNDTWAETIWSNAFDLIPKEWNDVVLYLPNNYETKLENRYGDWKTPKDSKGVVPQKLIL